MVKSIIHAILLLEGEEEGTTEERIEAMQYLIDTGLVYSLQGSYQRLAQAMVEDGVCQEATYD